jgi:hypothetical protein
VRGRREGGNTSRFATYSALAFAVVAWVVGGAMRDYFIPWPYLIRPYAELGDYVLVLGGILALVGIALAPFSGGTDSPATVPDATTGAHLLRLFILFVLVIVVTAFAIGTVPRPLFRPLYTPFPTIADTAVYGFVLVFPYAYYFVYYESPQSIGSFGPVGPWLVPEIGALLVALLILAGVGRGRPFHRSDPVVRRARPRCVTVLAALTMAAGGIIATAGYVEFVAGFIPIASGSPTFSELMAGGGVMLIAGLVIAISAEGLSVRHKVAWWSAFVGSVVAAAAATVPVLQPSVAGSSAFVIGFLLLERTEFGVLRTRSATSP